MVSGIFFDMHNDSFYLKNLLALSDKFAIETIRPVTADNGIKLIDSGVRLSRQMYEKLVLHKIAPPIDECLAVADGLSLDTIKDDLQQFMASHPCMAQLLDDGDGQKLMAMVSGLPFSSLASVKLTLLKEQLPHVYHHSLGVAVIAFVLAAHTYRDDPTNLPLAFAAGLFHDIGILHIDPSALDSMTSLGERKLKQIYAHPVIGHLVLERLSELPATVAIAVLEHHERLDGSGYPKGVSAESLSMPGQILAVAEVVATLFEKFPAGMLAKSLHVILRLNHGKLNRENIRHLIDLVMRLPVGRDQMETVEPSSGDMLANLVKLSIGIQTWSDIVSHLGSLASVELINRRITQLERNLAALGIDLQYWQMIDFGLNEDPGVIRELAIAAEEGNWQLTAIANEVIRKWDRLRPDNLAIQAEIWNWACEITGHH